MRRNYRGKASEYQVGRKARKDGEYDQPHTKEEGGFPGRLRPAFQAGAFAGISKDVPAGSRVFGIPAMDHEQWVRERAKVRRLPQLADQLKALIKRVDRLESSADD